MENPTIQDVIKKVKKYNRRLDYNLILKAYEYAKKHHGGQVRKTGEPYIIHPLHVANTLTELEVDDASIAAAMLHDVLEDTEVGEAELKKEFGEEIFSLVDGVTKLGKLEYRTLEEEQVENYRKMILAMGKDIRVILIKLADRLHNMRTLDNLSKERQLFNANETLELYAPLANRLGIYSLKWELENLSFKYLYPEEYEELSEQFEQKRTASMDFINNIMRKIGAALKKERIQAEITGREKHLYSIYRKMKRDNKTIDQIYDLFALRIFVNSIKDCYAALRNSTRII